MTQPSPDSIGTLDDALAHCFAMLTRGVADRRHAFHTPTLVNVDANGLLHARTLVLRGFDPQARMLRFHTDRRAGKCADLHTNPSVCVHAYDAKQSLQLRLAGTARLHLPQDDPAALLAWQNSREMSRKCYAIDPGPGAPIQAPLPAPTDPESGIVHFAVLSVALHRLEFLWLHASGHRRAAYDWTGTTPHATWLVP